MTAGCSGDLANELTALLDRLGGRAAGLWRRDGESLALVQFVGCRDLAEEVGREFAQATRRVSLVDRTLGIVNAARSGEVCVSLASQLAEGSGSGHWLRRFGASCSVAVPSRDAGGMVAGVISVALATVPDDDSAVVEQVRAAAIRWTFDAERPTMNSKASTGLGAVRGREATQ